MKPYDIIIAGGGPAGTSAAITAARAGVRVLLLERGQFPRHRVCGEFVSAESHDLLRNLLRRDCGLLAAAPSVTHARFFSDGRMLQLALPDPGVSISRYQLDWALWKEAEVAGVECRSSLAANEVVEHAVGFSIATADGRFNGKIFLNASGRWSNLTQPALKPDAPRWIGLKAHFRGECAPPSVDLYFFEGGYCGVQPVGDGLVNASCMVRADVACSLEEVFAANHDLWLRSRAWERETEVVTTSPLVFHDPKPTSGNVLNIGDSAAFIDPFVGDGISLALRSGTLAAESAVAVAQGKATLSEAVERYATAYRSRFATAYDSASLVRRVIASSPRMRKLAMAAMKTPGLGEFLIRRTRGA